jgi:hypothetical protein
MDVTETDVENLRRISEQIFGDKEYIEIEEVKDTHDDVMVSVRANEDADTSLGTRNAFAGDKLRTYHENGYVAVAVGGGNESHSAWFERADALDFGEPDTEPADEYDLRDDWNAVVGERYVVLHHGGDAVAHVKRDGWMLDYDTMYEVLPSGVAQALEDEGFVKGDVSDE